ncbi:MAG: flavin reductase family protein [Candidatus Schekmanbacteria bacterium]|nr:flavin reductase family protein [Candidatus Schekmanbacteria bacterium]
MNEAAKKKALLMVPYGLQVLGAKSGEAMSLSTVNWCTQCSFKPPLVAVALKVASHTHALVKEGGAFSLSFLGTGQKDVAFSFFKHSLPEGNTMAGHAFTLSPVTASPVLQSAPAWVECRVVGFYEHGDHSLVVGEVVEASANFESEPLTLKEVGAKYGG